MKNELFEEKKQNYEINCILSKSTEAMPHALKCNISLLPNK
jgi:hypothetical protein